MAISPQHNPAYTPGCGKSSADHWHYKRGRFLPRRASARPRIPGGHDPPFEQITNERIAHLADRLELVQGDLLDQASPIAAIVAAEPDEVYNLAAQSFVPTSWSRPVPTGEFTEQRLSAA
jgi:nucleoside-diphosphate-sugar epimerase